MRAFDYVVARTVHEAADLLKPNGRETRVLAGGTDLIVQLRENRRVVDLVVDIKQIPELNALAYSPEAGLSIGAAVPCFRIWNDPTIAALYPGLVEAVALIGGIQIQARATLGGNLGNASPAADSIPALITHEAICDIAGGDGMRSIPVEAFCAAPGKTSLQPGEFLVRLRVKPPEPGFGAHYLRFIPRNEMDIAVVGAGAALVLDADGATIRSARVALGAVAPTPLLVTEAGEFLAGRVVSDETIEQAAQIARAAARPITDVRGTAAQRQHLAGVLTRRALQRAIDRARASLQRNS
ncbi:MAG: xanthine dehydrogenase family protein subunit M [Anaerolineae bacterium]|nr:xanthine dehydrogenase family protein subunit M [Anaerolineae bacterium]